MAWFYVTFMSSTYIIDMVGQDTEEKTAVRVREKFRRIKNKNFSES